MYTFLESSVLFLKRRNLRRVRTLLQIFLQRTKSLWRSCHERMLCVKASRPFGLVYHSSLSSHGNKLNLLFFITNPILTKLWKHFNEVGSHCHLWHIQEHPSLSLSLFVEDGASEALNGWTATSNGRENVSRSFLCALGNDHKMKQLSFLGRILPKEQTTNLAIEQIVRWLRRAFPQSQGFRPMHLCDHRNGFPIYFKRLQRVVYRSLLATVRNWDDLKTSLS